MSRIIFVFGIAFLAVFPLAAAATERVFISSIKNTNSADVSALSAECRVGTDSRMTCDFVQTIVMLKMTPEKAAAEMEKGIADFRLVGAPSCKTARKDIEGIRDGLGKLDMAPRIKAF